MRSSTSQVRVEHESAAAARSTWVLALSLIAAGLGLQIVLFWDTAVSAVDIWLTNSAYNHCFIIAPISAYMAWQRRKVAARYQPTGSLLGVLVVGGAAFAWLVADIAAIDEGRHLAFVGMMQGWFLACLGWRVCRVMALPILYLLLMVPTGEFLLEPLQAIATSLSALMIGWFGVPIFVEGFYIQAPTGYFHVAPGCAGLNFVLATIAIVPLYTQLFYRPLWKQFATLAVALPLAIVLNGVRIALIIVADQWTEGNLSIVDDHLLYGWGFFAAVMFLAGYVGLYFADPLTSSGSANAGGGSSHLGGSSRRLALADRTVWSGQRPCGVCRRCLFGTGSCPRR